MPASLALTSPPSAHSARPRLLAVARARQGDRWLAWTLLGIGLPWLVYTRFYFFLQPRHLTYSGGPMMQLMKIPDPTCGGTRTFAWMWRGDLGHAVAVYPLGPLLFVGTIALVLYGAGVLVSGRALQFHLPRAMVTSAIVIGIVALGLNWIAKLLWLGM